MSQEHQRGSAPSVNDPRPAIGVTGRSFSVVVVYLVLALASGLLLVPKVISVAFAQDGLAVVIAPGEQALLVLQDLAICLVCFAVLRWWLARPTLGRVAVGCVGMGVLLLLLMFDARVRQLWLKPTDLALLGYALQNAGDLASGLEVFFNMDAGFGMTFRRLVVVVGALHFALWAGIAFAIVARGVRFPALVRLRGFVVLVGTVAAGLLGVSVAVGGASYHLDDNIFVRPLVEGLASIGASDEQVRALAGRFDQPEAPLSQQTAHPRARLPSAGRFRNLVFVVYESVRFAGLELDSPTTAAPVLARLAREGLLSRARVSVPHSSKAYYALLSGRHPLPAVEMKEATVARIPSVFDDLRQRGTKTYAFSSLNLAFENMGGLLRAAGVTTSIDTKAMAAAANREVPEQSSFGGGDAILYELAAAELARHEGPFAALLFPVAAHYPYHCPDGRDRVPDFDAYRDCLKEADRLLGDMMGHLRTSGVLKDTLLVVVGDHGESFGEHGRHIHNTSMFEEEVSVPAVFWAADGSLRYDGVVPGRQIDVAPTIADLMGLLERATPVQGVSLLRVTEHQRTYMATFFEGMGMALVDHPRKYIFDVPDSRLTRYDLVLDPEERNGTILVDGDEKRAVLEKLRAFNAYQQLAFP